MSLPGQAPQASDPLLLGEYLLGDLHAGPGLLSRVAQRVKLVCEADGPAFKTGSVMLLGSGKTKEDDALAETSFDLLVRLMGWLEGRDVPARDVAGSLRKHGLTDAALLLGTENGTGRLDQARETVRAALIEPSLADVGRLLELVPILQGFLGGACEHEWDLSTVEGDIEIHECSLCGTGRYQYRGSGAWLAV